MTKIKICGLSRPIDIDWINEAKPDYCGFIINVPKSRRNVDAALLKSLRSRLDEAVTPVGVFVNEAMETIIALTEQHLLGAVQLHGSEDDLYIKTLQREVSVPVIKAYQIDSEKALQKAESSPADFILFDNGEGGTGRPFNWSLLHNIRRPFFLAGGLGPHNLKNAIQTIHPWGVDMSSGVETDHVKDKEKILAAITAVRRTEI